MYIGEPKKTRLRGQREKYEQKKTDLNLNGCEFVLCSSTCADDEHCLVLFLHRITGLENKSRANQRKMMSGETIVKAH